MELKGKKVLIFQQRNWGAGIGYFLAEKLYSEGCRLAALTIKKTTHDAIVNQSSAKYDLIINSDEAYADPEDYLNGEDPSLGEICDDLGVDSVWPLVSTLRNHVKSYKDKYYFGFKQNVPDEEIVYTIKATYKYIKIIFKEFGPDIIIAPNFVSLPHIMFNLYAKKRGVPMIAVADSKVKGNWIFSQGYSYDSGEFYDRVDELNIGKKKSLNRERARKYIKECRIELKKPDYAVADNAPRTFIKKLKRDLAPYYLVLRWYLKRPENYLKSTGITTDYRPPRIILRDHYCHKYNRKCMQKFDYYPFDKIKKFIYFPLQVQPEETIDVAAPFFSNQIETARQVAMSMPDDYVLVVKEHPAMLGLRPPSYLEKIARTVNIKLIDYRIPSEEVLKRADMVVSPNSTTIAEAAFYWKPAIQLGNLGTTQKLPNVFIHRDMTTLGSKIKDVLKINLRTDDYERRLENYVAAVFDTGFSLDYFAMWECRADVAEELWVIYKNEIERVFIEFKK